MPPDMPMHTMRSHTFAHTHTHTYTHTHTHAHTRTQVRAALAAAGVDGVDMPSVEDRAHGAWQRQSKGGGGMGKERRKEKVSESAAKTEGDSLRPVPGGKQKKGKKQIKHSIMKPAALLAVSMMNSLKSTAFANNGMLSTKQGRQKWKRLACERDLAKFGKSIKCLEANLVWGAVTRDFDDVRQQLLHGAGNLQRVDDAVKALTLLDGCILDSFRRKTSARSDDGQGDGGDPDDHDDDIEGTEAYSSGSPSDNVRGVGGLNMRGMQTLRLRGGKAYNGLVAGTRPGPRGRYDRREVLSTKRGEEMVGKEIRVRSKCNLSGRFRWIGAKVVGFEVRDAVPVHCIEMLNADTVAGLFVMSACGMLNV
jgi:hypothetical protein